MIIYLLWNIFIPKREWFLAEILNWFEATGIIANQTKTITLSFIITWRIISFLSRICQKYFFK